jgi:hypothetical protein
LIACFALAASAGWYVPECADADTCADAIELAFEQANAADDPEAVIDLSGHWLVDRPVALRCERRCRVIAGTIEARATAEEPLPYVVEVDLPGGSEIDGILRVQGRSTSWHRHRTAVDGVHLYRVQGVKLDGLDVKWVRRWGVRTATRPGWNAIGADLGMVRVSMAGAPGGINAPPHTRVESAATRIERHGGGRSALQRATVTVDQIPVDVEPGDRAWVGLNLVEVVAIDREAVTLSVYPWPGGLEGDGDWVVDYVIGGGLAVHGNNTTGLAVDALFAGYVGVGIEVVALYGASIRAPVVEVAGVGLVIGGRRAVTWGLAVYGLHPELVGVDVLQAGRNVQRCLILSPVVDLTSDRYHVERPTLVSGAKWDSPAWDPRCDQVPTFE